jgi:hypothetical protein
VGHDPVDSREPPRIVPRSPWRQIGPVLRDGEPAQGNGDGTRALIEVLLPHRHLPAAPSAAHNDELLARRTTTATAAAATPTAVDQTRHPPPPPPTPSPTSRLAAKEEPSHDHRNHRVDEQD